jgi:hypothetical protein
MAEPGLQSQQQPAELFALLVVKTDEQRVLSFALGLGGETELLLTRSSEGDDVTAAIRSIALAGDETVGLQGIEHGHQDARVGTHRLAKLRLTHRSAIVQQTKQMKLTRRQMLSSVRVAQAPHRDMTQQRQQQTGTRASLLQNSTLARGRYLRDLYRHPADTITSYIVKLAIWSRYRGRPLCVTEAETVNRQEPARCPIPLT